MVATRQDLNLLHSTPGKPDVALLPFGPLAATKESITQA